VGFGRRHIRLLLQEGAGAPWEVEVAFKWKWLFATDLHWKWLFATDLHFPVSSLSLSSGCSLFSQQIEVKG
jgi:hypothetical protein